MKPAPDVANLYLILENMEMQNRGTNCMHIKTIISNPTEQTLGAI